MATQKILVGKIDELAPQTGKTVLAAGRKVALFNLQGEYLAVDDFCPHRGASLGEGFLHGDCVLCPWHCFDFNLRTGHSETAPHLRIPTYQVEITDENIYVICED